MIPQLHNINDAETFFRSKYPDVFTGLGKLKGEYRIKLKDTATPYALSVPRRVAIPLRSKVKEFSLNEKSQFAMNEICFQGHVINSQGIKADPDKIQAILDMLEPKDVTDVRRFMGMVNFVGKFSAHLLELTKPIRELLKADNSWTWDAPQRQAFQLTKKELSPDTVLAQYSPKRETMVSADASSYGLGGVLIQKQTDREWRGFFISRSLTKTESRYAQIEKEALAITWACERLQGYLRGMDFTICTDHKPLITLLKSRALDAVPPRILRFRLRLLSFNINIIHTPGKNLITADALSRAPLPMTTTETE